MWRGNVLIRYKQDRRYYYYFDLKLVELKQLRKVSKCKAIKKSKKSPQKITPKIATKKLPKKSPKNVSKQVKICTKWKLQSLLIKVTLKQMATNLVTSIWIPRSLEILHSAHIYIELGIYICYLEIDSRAIGSPKKSGGWGECSPAHRPG